MSSSSSSAQAAKPSGSKPILSSISTSERIAAHTHITGLGLDEYGQALAIPVLPKVDDPSPAPAEAATTSATAKDSTASTTDTIGVEKMDTSVNEAVAAAAAAAANLTTVMIPGGLVGQVQAREACGIVVELIREQKLAGRALLLTGPPGTGKTALALAMAKELGKGVPFCLLTASAVYSRETTKTEILQEHVRKALGLRIREQKEVYEGEVTELTVQETQDPLAGAASYGRTISHVVLGLKTTKGTKTLKLDPTMYDALSKEKVTIGDVIYIEANSGAVKRVGRSDSFAAEFDLEAEEYVPLPKGDVHKKKQVVQDVTLHDLDVANAHPAHVGGGMQKQRDVLSLLQAMGRPRKTEITEKLRNEINKVVTNYVNDGVAELIPGVLFIDEVHMLDLECFSFLNRSLESPLSPIVVLATNRGVTHIRGGDGLVAPHGIPVDFLDRLLIVPTRVYTVPEMIHIIALRAKTESLSISQVALQAMGEIGGRTSLRYAVQMLTPASILAETCGRTTIEPQDVEAVDALFLDGKASAQMLQENSQAGYLS